MIENATSLPPVAEANVVNGLRRAEGVTEHTVDGELVLYDPVRQRVHVLNASAAVIWQLCDGTRTRNDFATALAWAWPEARSDFHADVADILRELEAEGLLVAS